MSLKRRVAQAKKRGARRERKAWKCGTSKKGARRPDAAWALLALALLLTACGCQGPIPVVDPAHPPAPGPVNPGPIDPGPVAPPADGEGTITMAAYNAVADGATEADVYAALGKPFRRTETGGYSILVYSIRGSDSVAWFFLRDGKLDHKRSL
jgi:hypothetical protein